MSAPSPSPTGNPAPPAVPAPPGRSASRGCVPALVFLLVMICAGSLVILYSGWAVRNTGRVVVEVLERNSPAEMESLQRLATTEIILDAVIKRLNLDPGPQDDGRYQLHERILKSLQVDVDGRFLVITVDEREKSPATLANAVAGVLEENMVTLEQEKERRFSQAMEAKTREMEGSAEKARLVWMDMIKKHNLEPVTIAAEEEAAAEISKRSAQIQAELIMMEARLAILKDGDEAKARLATEQDALKAAKAEFQKQLKAASEKAMARETRRSDLNLAKSIHQQYLTKLEKMRSDYFTMQLGESVVKHPLRTVDNARIVKAPDRRFRRNLELAAMGSGILLAGLLLASLTRFLRRA